MSPSGRKRLRLILRDLSATSAFASIVLSGTVPAWALAAYGLALLTSLLNRRPLAARPTISVVLLLVTAAILFGAAFRGAMDLVVSACTFAGLVTSHRLLSEPTPGTDQQVHLTSLLMLAGGAALAGELWYGLCLAAFAMTSSVSLGLSVIEPEGGSPEHFEVRPLVRGIALGSVIALLGAVAFFFVFPRLSWNIAARRVPPGFGGTTGMSDSVRLSGAGDIKSSPRIVARVRMSPDPKVDELNAYFPGRSFDTFDGREWRGSGRPLAPRAQIDLPSRATRKRVSQFIELLPGYESRTLIALEQPVQFTWAQASSTSGTSRAGLVEVTGEEVRFATSANAYRYTAVSVPPEAAGRAQPLDDLSAYDTPPPGLDPRVQQLTEHVLGTERRPLAAAAALQRYLQREYSYTLELAGEVGDPLADFLFVRKAGHCEHFATALTLMLRSVHIPARVTAGFFGGERIGSSYVLRAGDAHAWTQVYAEGEGWVTVDATPEIGRRNQPARLLAWLTTLYERLEEWWRLRVVDYSFQDQIDIARSLVRPPGSAQGSRWSLPSLREIGPWAAALAVGLAVYQLVQRIALKATRRRHPASTFLDQLEERLDRAGIGRLPHEPIEELSARLSEAAHPIAAPLSEATRAYLAARFGGAALTRARQAELLEQMTVHPERRSPKGAGVEGRR